MTRLLPEILQIGISRSRSLPTKRAVEKLQHLLILLHAGPADELWNDLPFGDTLAALVRRRSADSRRPLCTHFPAAGRAGVTVGFLSPADPLPKQHTEIRKLATSLLADGPETVGVVALGFDDELTRSLQGAALTALLLAAFQLPTQKRKSDGAGQLRRLRLFGPAQGLDLTRIRAEAEGNNLARWLTAMPPNRLDALGYREIVKQLAGRAGWKMRFLDETALQKKGAGAFLAVSQGNATRDAGIIHLRYRPGKAAAKPRLCLVGKGICFDTGGNNLKPFKGMLDMHGDMQGSAVALGTLLALTRIRYGQAVDCWLAVTENRIGPAAYKSRDVVTASNGVTIEVIHTDAEGRMVLADTLALAASTSPDCIIDYATLTGACVAALTTRYSGVFSNRGGLYPMLTAAGVGSGERVWGFPMDADFVDALESKSADIAQCSQDNAGDHILAARFLQRFVDDSIPWVHMDLAASEHKGGLGLVPTDFTGFGVRYTLNLLLDQDLLKRLPAGAEA